MGFTLVEVKCKNIIFRVFDIGGHREVRPLWNYKHFLEPAQALIFVIDSSDKERLEEVREELTKLIDNEYIRDAPFLILANKHDLQYAMTTRELTERLNLEGVLRNRRWIILETSAVKCENIFEGLNWICKELDKKD